MHVCLPVSYSSNMDNSDKTELTGDKIRLEERETTDIQAFAPLDEAMW